VASAQIYPCAAQVEIAGCFGVWTRLEADEDRLVGLSAEPSLAPAAANGCTPANLSIERRETQAATGRVRP